MAVSRLERAFAARWTPVPETGCWLWTGNWNYAGYGVLPAGRAHRISWRLHRGDIPQGLFVCHKCDTRCCVNPDHLFLGTCAANLADMRAKGRGWWLNPNPTQHARRGPESYVRGANALNAKLNDAAVVEIRQLWREGQTSQGQLARSFGVNKALIQRVVTNKSWTHVREQ